VRRQFGKTIVEIARQDPNIVLLYGDVKQNMDEFEAEFPDRIFNCGICEQSTVSMAAGMALEGLVPFVYSLTPFLTERAMEQWKMDVDVMKARVIGIGYSFYPTHGNSQSPVDLTGNWLVGTFKNIQTYYPCNSETTAEAIWHAYRSG